MTSEDDAIESALTVPPEMAAALSRYRVRQERDRGDWPDPSHADQPDPPWPDEHNPMVRYLLWRCTSCIAAGMTPKIALIQLAVDAWFEGGIENYDRGRRDGLGAG